MKGNVKKFIGNILIALAILLFPIASNAEVKEIISEGTYNMGDGETPIVAEDKALLQAKRTSLEQAGTYVESYSKVKNYQLTEDEIQVLASGIIEVSVLAKKRTIVGDGFNFWVKIKALVSMDKMEEMVKRVKEKSVLEDYKSIQVAYDKIQKENQALKKQLAATKTTQGKKKIKTEIAANEKLFQANEWFEKGYKYVLNREYDTAIKAYTAGIDLNPKYPLAFNNRGLAYANKGQLDRAIEDFKKAISINPEFALAYYNHGNAYYQKGEYDRAIEDFNKAISLKTDFAEAYGNRGYAYYQKGQLDRAIEDYNKAIDISPNLAEAYSNRGLAYTNKGELDRAIEDYNKSIDINPNLAEGYNNRGYAYHYKGELGRAIEDYNKAIDINPNIVNGYNNRGYAYYQKGQLDRAIEDFKKAISINPNSDKAYNNRGNAYLKLNDYERSISDFKVAARLGNKSAQDVLDNLEKQQATNTKSNNLSTSSENIPRIYKPGDYFNYKVTGFVNQGGIDIPIFGIAQIKVLDETKKDYYGNTCYIFRMTTDFTVIGKDRSAKVKMSEDQYYTQDSNGSMMSHGKQNNGKIFAFVKTPSTGWYYEYKFPFSVHDSSTQNILYTDGSSQNRTDMILGLEQISVPAGTSNAYKTVSNTLTTNANSTKTQVTETTWIVPKIGPIRSNIESSSGKESSKFILEMTDTNILYK